jgi:hypothetical protein
MKNLQSVIEGNWVKLNQIQLTEEQKILLSSTNSEDQEAIETLRVSIKSQRETKATKADAALAQAKYVEIKPAVDEYQLIAMDINIDSMSGILNYRVKGEHKQIRF